MVTLTAQQVAKMLNIHPQTVCNKAKAGEIPSWRTSSGPKGRYRFNLTDIQELISVNKAAERNPFRNMPRDPK